MNVYALNAQELCAHPFWQVRLPTLDLPPEPALEAFIARYNLAPTIEEMRQSTRDGLKVSARQTRTTPMPCMRA